MLKAIDVCKTYIPKKGVPVKALSEVNLEFGETGLVFILGKSGSGKSTLLNVLGGLDSIDVGDIKIKGRSYREFTQGDFDAYRNTYVGFVFQDYNILNEFTIGANIALALQLQGKKATDERVNEILEEVDLVGYGNRKPNELSGGQKQRVAIARALIKDPQIIMADEPTGALDSATGIQVFDTLKKLAKNKLVIVVSHDREFAERYGDRVIELADGRVVSDITKCAGGEETMLEGLRIVDEDILHIKKGYKLTESDKERIARFIDEAKSDTVVSRDERSNTEIKHLVNYDESSGAVFKDTAKEDIAARKYGDDECKFIKARFPFKHAFRMGMSGLKVKPFRLCITILLSCMAFVLFGFVDTFGSYDKVTIATNALIEDNIEYAAFEKNELSEHGINYYYEQGQLLNDDDITYIENQSGLSLSGVYGGQIGSSVVSTYFSAGVNDNLIDATKIRANYYYSNNNFYQTDLKSISDMTSETIEKLGFKVHGRLPEADDEIALPMYYYDMFAIAGFKNMNDGYDEAILASKLTYEGTGANSILNKHIDYSFSSGRQTFNGYLKIVGIIDTNCSTEGFEQFLPSNTNYSGSDVSHYEESKMDSYLNDSFHKVAAVTHSFIKNITDETKNSYLPPYITEPETYTNLEAKNKNGIIGTVQLTGFAKTSAISNVPHVTFENPPEKNGIYVSTELINSVLKEIVSDDIIDVSVSIPTVYGSFKEEKYKTSISFINAGYPYIAITDYVNAMSDDEVNTLLKKDFPVRYLRIKEVDISDFSISQKSCVLAAIMFVPYCYDEVMLEEHYNDLYYTSTDSFKCAYEVISAQRMNYLISQNLLDLSEYKLVLTHKNVNYEFSAAGYYIPTHEYDFDSCKYAVYGDDLYDVLNYTSGENYMYSRAIGLIPNGYDVGKAVSLGFKTPVYSKTGEFAYFLRNHITKEISSIDSALSRFSSIFIAATVVLAIFAALLLWNYISVSISNKRKEIGILRAVGAKSIDVFWIFFIESVMIGLISFALSTIICAISVYCLSLSFANNIFKVGFTLFSVGIRQVLLILAIATGVTLVGSAIPVYMICKQKPIDAIADR